MPHPSHVIPADAKNLHAGYDQARMPAFLRHDTPGGMRLFPVSLMNEAPAWKTGIQ